MTINTFPRKDRIFYISSFLAIVFLAGCQKQPTLNFGNGFVSDNGSANIVLVDTSTVAMSTLRVDSTATAGSGYLLVGNINDPIFGNISTRSFMQLTPPGLPTISRFDTYDSIALILRFKKGNPFYGDSTVPQTFVVNQVDTLYQLPSFSRGFFSNSSLPISSIAWGSASANIFPGIPHTSQGIGDTLKIRLDQNLGATLYNMVYNKSDTVTKPQVWQNWFHGICISPAPGSQGAIYGFLDSAVMRIYYHENQVYAVQKFIDFNITNKSYQFNNIAASWTNPNPTQPPLNKLIKPTQGQKPPATPSALVANAGYIQSITGLNVKLTFPYLKNIKLRQDYLSVLRAVLSVRPVPGSWSTSWPLPPQILVSDCNQENVIGAPVPNSQTGQQQTGGLDLDYLHPLNTVYTYDVSVSIKNLINKQDQYADSTGLVLSIPNPANGTSFTRAVLADQHYPLNQRISLLVYYVGMYPHQ